MLTQMITETLLGALTGYVTNNTAIRSLFQPGGVIEKTRDEFAREAGRLLEDQVLTQQVLAQQLQLPEVQQILAQALEAFLKEALPAAFAHQTLADLPGNEQTIVYLQQVLLQFCQKEQDKILSMLKKHLSLGELLTEAQCQQFAATLERLLLDTLQQENLTCQFLQSWQTEKGEHTVEQLGLGELCTVIVANAAKQSQRWSGLLQEQYSQELAQLLLETIQKLQLRPVLLELDQQMEQYTLQQYCSCDAQELVDLFCTLLNSADGQQLLALLAEQLMEALIKVEVPLVQIVPAEILEAVAPVLQQKMPVVLELLVNWLEQNQQSVNAMLESAINEVVAASGGMKGLLLEQLKDTILEQTLQQAEGAAFLEQFLLNGQNTKQTVDLLMQKISAVLTEQSMGELVQCYNQQGQLQAFLQSFLTAHLQQFLQQSGVPLAEQLLAVKPGSLHLAQRQTKVEQLVRQFLLHGLQQIDIQSLILHNGQQLQRLRIGQFLKLDGKQAQQLLEQLVQKSCAQLAQQLPNMTADEILRPLYASLEQWLQQQGLKWLREQGKRCSLPNLIQIIKPAFQRHQPQILQWLSATGLKEVQGRLSQLAETQIGALREDEMLRLVEDFMGQELKPLNYLGAGMGAVAGATVGTALAAALPITATANPAMMLSVLAGKSAVFGAVGYGTNCAAVKGLFWPYSPLGGIQMLQGVIPKQKERFAHSMGQMVDRYVINDDVLKGLLEQNQHRWLQVGTAFAGDQQRMAYLSAILSANRKKLADLLIQQVDQCNAVDRKQAISSFGSMPLVFLHANAPDREVHFYTQVLKKLEQQVNLQLQQTIPLQNIVSAEQLWQGASQWISTQPVPDLVHLVHQLLQTEKSLEQLVPVKQQQEWQLQLQHGVASWLEQQQNCADLARQLGKLLPEDRLKQWLEDNSEQWLEENLSKLFSWLERTLLQMLSKKQVQITIAVQQSILNRMGLMQQLGYTMMGGDELVAQVVERVLQQKLPILLTVKRKELSSLFSQCWQQHIFPALLQVPVQQQQVQNVLETLLAQPAVGDCVGKVLGASLQIFCRQPIAFWGKWLTLDVLLERVQTQLGFQWQMHSAEAIVCWQPFVQKFCSEQILTMSLRQLTKGFSGTLPFTQIIECQAAQPLFSAFSLRFQENLAITKPQQWCDWSAVTAVLERTVSQLLQDDHTRQWILYEAEQLIIQLSVEWDQLLPEQSRNALLQAIVQAIFFIAQKEGSHLLSAMQLAKLTEVQITQMDSAHLEQVVRGFAGSYLVHIENRGWLGAIFALPGMLFYLL